MKGIIISLTTLIIIGCVPIKKASNTNTRERVEYGRYDSLFRSINNGTDLVLQQYEQSKGQESEVVNENIDYTESRYDTLGRLIAKIEQNTIRGKTRDIERSQNTNTNIGVTVQQVDSIVSIKIEGLKADIKTKTVTKEKRGLMWWQKALIWVGMSSIVILIAFIIIKLTTKTQWWKSLLHTIKRS